MERESHPSNANPEIVRRGMSVSTKIILVQMVVVLVAMIANGTTTYLQTSSQLRHSLDQKGNQLIQRLPSSMATPLWNFDSASIETLLNQEMTDSDIQAIVVKGDSGASGKIRDAKGAPIAITDANTAGLSSTSLHHLKSDIKYQDKVIGTADVYLSDASIVASLRSALLQTALMAVGILTLLSISTFLITRFLVAKPVRLVGKSVEEIAQGDLSSTVNFSSRDELGSLAGAVNEMVARLRDMVVQIRETSGQLNESSTEIEESSRQLASGAQSQAATLEETSAAVEELTASVEQVASHAQNQSASVERSSVSMKEMRVSAQSVSTTLHEVSESSQESVRMAHSGVEAVNATVTAIEEISQKSEQIGTIITVISDIADQTNLLALNASIEAARAGEHGRGFAVVAQEVSKLAERSASSTREIQQLIDDSGKNVTKGVKVAQGALGAMDAIITGAQKTNKAVSDLSTQIQGQIDSIASVASATEEITEMSHSISAATEEQTTNARQVAAAVENVNELTQQAATAAGQMSDATIQLHQLSQQLSELMGQFALDRSVTTPDGERAAIPTETRRTLSLAHAENV